MNDLSRPDLDRPALPANQHWIDGSQENAQPSTVALNQYPDDRRVMHSHLLYSDDTVRVERKKLEVFPGYRGPTDHLCFITDERGDRLHLFQLDHPILTINDRYYHLKMASPEQVIVLRTGAGDDHIRVDDEVRLPVFIDSGAGDDQITCGGGFTKVNAGTGDDRVFSRSGASYIEAGAGNDLVRAMGCGPTTVYGGAGDDLLVAGEGACFMDGGQGDDRLFGGQGHNVLSGADGNDQIVPGPGHNSVYTGTGMDVVEPLGPNTRLFNAYAADGPVPPGSEQAPGVVIAAKALDSCGVVVEGSAEFQERVNDDLRLLLGSDNGRQLLAVLGEARQKSGVAVVIKELTEEENGMCFPNPPQPDIPFEDGHPFIENGHAGTPVKGCTVYYDPSFLKGEITSIVHLYHELCHAYNFVTGTTFPGFGRDGADANRFRFPVPNAELQAVGLEANALPFDFDRDPTTAPLSSNPEPFSENGLRLELGLPPRKQYREA